MKDLEIDPEDEVVKGLIDKNKGDKEGGDGEGGDKKE